MFWHSSAKTPGRLMPPRGGSPISLARFVRSLIGRAQPTASREVANGAGASAENAAGPLPLRAYVTRRREMPLVPAAPKREWMDHTASGFANRCLPLLIANQWGWFILNDRRIEVLWNGGSGPKDLHIHYAMKSRDERLEPDELLAVSHFGHGVLTWRIPYLFRTPAGWNLYVRGPANCFKDGASPLDGVVETDWSSATFTMNWKVTRADTWLSFDEGEPICMIFPVGRGAVERFLPEIRPLPADPEIERRYKEWKRGRDDFNRALRNAGPEKPWQKHYFRGLSALGEAFPGHQTRIAVHKFRDLR